jgi:hypothetical protein
MISDRNSFEGTEESDIADIIAEFPEVKTIS